MVSSRPPNATVAHNGQGRDWIKAAEALAMSLMERDYHAMDVYNPVTL